MLGRTFDLELDILDDAGFLGYIILNSFSNSPVWEAPSRYLEAFWHQGKVDSWTVLIFRSSEIPTPILSGAECSNRLVHLEHFYKLFSYKTHVCCDTIFVKKFQMNQPVVTFGTREYLGSGIGKIVLAMISRNSIARKKC